MKSFEKKNWKHSIRKLRVKVNNSTILQKQIDRQFNQKEIKKIRKKTTQYCNIEIFRLLRTAEKYMSLSKELDSFKKFFLRQKRFRDKKVRALNLMN